MGDASMSRAGVSDEATVAMSGQFECEGAVSG